MHFLVLLIPLLKFTYICFKVLFIHLLKLIYICYLQFYKNITPINLSISLHVSLKYNITFCYFIVVCLILRTKCDLSLVGGKCMKH